MYKSTTHIQRSSTRQALRAARLAPSLVVFSFLCLALSLAPRPASAFGSYGPPVDSYCLSYDGSTPYQDSGCLLCHTSNSGSGAPGKHLGLVPQQHLSVFLHRRAAESRTEWQHHRPIVQSADRGRWHGALRRDRHRCRRRHAEL